MTPLAVPPLVFVAALLAACLGTVAAWRLWRHGDVPVPRRVEGPYLRIMHDPAPFDWAELEQEPRGAA